VNEMLLSALLGNAVLLAVFAYLAVEIRRDVRETRDKVLVMWEWYQTIVERRQNSGAKEV
jgi:hypothetical protein